MQLDWLKAREKLDLLFGVLESIQWSLRKDKLKIIITILSKSMIEFEGVGTYESQDIILDRLQIMLNK